MGTQHRLIDPTLPMILIDSPPAVKAGSPRCSTTWRQPIIARNLETK